MVKFISFCHNTENRTSSNYVKNQPTKRIQNGWLLFKKCAKINFKFLNWINMTGALHG